MMPISAPDKKPRGEVAFAAPQLAPVAEGEIGIDDAAREIERHGKAELGHRLGENLARGDDMNAAREQLLIGHVVDEICLDIEHAAQRGELGERRLRDRRLADDVAGLGKHRLRQRLDSVGGGLVDAVLAAQRGERGRGEDQLERARLRRTDDQRLGAVGHRFPP